MYGGNLCFAVWAMYMAAPLANMILPEDNGNLSSRSEKAFLNDSRFVIP